MWLLVSCIDSDRLWEVVSELNLCRKGPEDTVREASELTAARLVGSKLCFFLDCMQSTLNVSHPSSPVILK